MEAMGTQAREEPHPHLHLKVVQKPAWDWARWVVVLLALGGAGLFVVSFFQPWWKFWLYAPQYPDGLKLVISLTGMKGDVHEIDLLNHYIGMHHLEDAAPTERRLAGWGIALVATATIALSLASGRKLSKVVAIPAILLPIGFIADSFYWLYSFGHHLDPKAPLKIGVFTPQLFGNGKIGQFETYAEPALGFWIAVAGVVLVIAGTVIRSRVCAYCARASTCGATCPRLLVLPDKEHTDA
jgi:copper chaperone NosL